MDDSLDTPLKRCSRCHEWQPATLDYFSRNKSHPSGMQNQCKACCKEQYHANQAMKPPVEPPHPVLEKACNQCGQVKPNTEEFFRKQKRKNGNYGLIAVCKECKKVEMKQYREVNKDRLRRKQAQYQEFYKEEIKLRNKLYHQRNKERHSARNRVYAVLHREEARIKRRDYYMRHSKRIKEDRKRYRETFREKVSTSKRLYGRTHKEQIRQYHSVYRATHRDLRRTYWHKRRARLKQIGGSYTAEDIRQQYKRQKGHCYYCRQKLTNYQIDHVIPITRAGSSNDPWNLVLACPTCNSKKNNRLPHEWPEGNRLL